MKNIKTTLLKSQKSFKLLYKKYFIRRVCYEAGYFGKLSKTTTA